ncbi:MAG TPA: LysM peptidoglycan-binding domain-containing protein [Nocardioidaceae bacterium]|nr:LysM peptidoglycan-binding domain-containing protein [Nocardioidaceae bacterium]
MSTTVIDLEAVRDRRPTAAPPGRPARCPAERQPPSAVRLTRRGRVVVLVGVLTLALALFIWFGAPAASTDHVRHVPATTVVVQPGQTLWDIAHSVAPQEDPREVIASIVDLNALPDAGAIRAGQPLYVPVE